MATQSKHQTCVLLCTATRAGHQGSAIVYHELDLFSAVHKKKEISKGIDGLVMVAGQELGLGDDKGLGDQVETVVGAHDRHIT